MTMPVLEGVTGVEVRDAMIAAEIHHVDHHECSICGCMVRFLREGDQLLWDGGCDCPGWQPPRPVPWQQAADWINMQPEPRWQEDLRRRFGLPVPG